MVVVALLVLVALGSSQEGSVPPDPALVERRLGAMGTWLDVRVTAADRATGLAASERAVRAIAATEERLSTWSEDSELARLNRAPVGEAFALSPELAADLWRARDLWRATDGAFDPGLGALIEAWGLRTGGRTPTVAELDAALAPGGFAGFELAERSASRRHARAAIEEGGFGKGVGLDAAIAALGNDGVRTAVLDLGGQLAVFGAPCATLLADPRERDRPVLALDAPPGSLATSGTSERGRHILDPRTGSPAADFGSISVWAADATAADCLSTGLYVLGPERAFAWRAAHPGIELIVLCVERDDDGTERLHALASPSWRDRVRPLVDDLELSIVPEGSLSISIPIPANHR